MKQPVFRIKQLTGSKGMKQNPQIDRQTGFPSIDRPWLKYYSEEAIHSVLPETTMFQYIWERNKDNLSDIALIYFGRKISYKEFFDQVRKVADALFSYGIRAGDIVSIMSIHTPETIYTLYALNYIGAIANMVYLTLPEKEILDSLTKTDSKLLICLDMVVDRVSTINGLPCPVVVLNIDSSMPFPVKVGYRIKTKKTSHRFLTWEKFLYAATENAIQHNDADDPAIIVYTTGTTGEPKGVVLNSIAMNAVSDQLTKTDRNYKRQETFLHQMPVFVAFGLGMLHHGLSVGICLILGLANDVESASKLFSKYKPQRFVSGPPVLDGIMKYTKGSLKHFIEFTGGGEAISPDKEDEFNAFLKKHKSPTQYMPGYGMSEFASVATMNMKAAYKKGSVGIPLVHICVKVVDTETGNELKYGEIGELCFNAPNSLTCYYKNPDATNKAIEMDSNNNKWIHTEDLGYVDEDGFVFIVGRLKRVYVTRDMDGFIVKIYPQRIEDVINSNSMVQNSAVIVRKDNDRFNVPIAFVTVKDDESKSTSQVIEGLNALAIQELPEYDRPEKFIILRSMPITQSGKIDYQALEKMIDLQS